MGDEIGDIHCTVCEDKVKVGLKGGIMVVYCGCDVALKVANMDSPYVMERWE